MKLKFLTLLLFASTFLTLKAQLPEKKEYDFLVSGVPQYLITKGIRIDFDIHQKETSKWLILSPYYYSDHSPDNDEYYYDGYGYADMSDPYNFDQMTGFGMGIARRTFLSKKPVSEGFYLSYGVSYKYFNIYGNGDYSTWVEFTGDDDLLYQRMEDIEYNLYIHSMGANAMVGYQKQVIPSLYVDAFIGFGIKYSIHTSPENVTTKYNRGYTDYGYTGTHLVGGIRLGIGL